MHAAEGHGLPELSRTNRHALTRLIAQCHPHAEDGRGDDDPAEDVIGWVADQQPPDVEQTFWLLADQLGLTDAEARRRSRLGFRRLVAP